MGFGMGKIEVSGGMAKCKISGKMAFVRCLQRISIILSNVCEDDGLNFH